MQAYQEISIAGGDTSQPLAMQKRIDFIRQGNLPEGTRFLDCGCGAGDYVFALIEQLGFDAHGIEFDADKVKAGNQHPLYGERILQGDLQSIKFDDQQWDAAMLNEVLEHVPNEQSVIREVHRVLKPGGILFVSSPNRWYPFESHGVYWKGQDVKLSPWTPLIPYLPVKLGRRFFDYWARNYWPSELRALLSSAGFSIVKTGYIWQTFEGISRSQPTAISKIKPLLRTLANSAEKTPFLRRFGVSQVIVCQKAP